MAEITLKHEDIYVYIYKIQSATQTITGSTASSISLTNNATNMIADYGELTISVTSGTLTGFILTANSKTISKTVSVTSGQNIKIDLRNKMIYHSANGVTLLGSYDDILNDNASNTITLTCNGTCTKNISYVRNQVTTNNNDLYYCEGLDYSTDSEINSTKDVKGKIKFSKSEKKSHNWSINGLWNNVEFEKFNSPTGRISLKLVDIDLNVLNILANCNITSSSKSSSDDGDYTYSLSGNCEEIY